jgi:hypothetical protein
MIGFNDAGGGGPVNAPIAGPGPVLSPWSPIPASGPPPGAVLSGVPPIVPPYSAPLPPPPGMAPPPMSLALPPPPPGANQPIYQGDSGWVPPPWGIPIPAPWRFPWDYGEQHRGMPGQGDPPSFYWDDQNDMPFQYGDVFSYTTFEDGSIGEVILPRPILPLTIDDLLGGLFGAQTTPTPPSVVPMGLERPSLPPQPMIVHEDGSMSPPPMRLPPISAPPNTPYSPVPQQLFY